MWDQVSDRSRQRPGSQRFRREGRTQGRGFVAPALRSVPWTARGVALAVVLLAIALLPSAAASARGGGGGGGGGGQAAAPKLPADFPADIALPPGTLQGATGGAGRWSVLLLARGSAAAVLRSTERFYIAAGFSREAYAIVHRGSERITIVAENRDHSATETNLTLGVTDSKTGPGPAPSLVATILPGPRRVSLANAKRHGLRVRFTAPAAARSATVRAYRTAGGTRRLLGPKTAAVHGGRNAIALDAAAIRRRTKPGSYALDVVLHGAGGTQGPRAQTSVRVAS
jgi:hypothetical protein